MCFDTGGLDLKPAGGMRLMKKDMGGAAIMLGLAQAIMDAKLPVRLRVLLPCVENSVSGNAMRPLDIVRTRKGLTVEIGNTDAEGRLILCDALAEASSENPADADRHGDPDRCGAGGARPRIAGALLQRRRARRRAARRRRGRRGPAVADAVVARPTARCSTARSPTSTTSPRDRYAGAITAALYLQEFVSPASPGRIST